MATPPLITATQCFVPKTKEEEEKAKKIYKRYRDLVIPNLPRQKGWMSEHLHMYQGFWIESATIQGALYFQEHFKARPTDVLVATYPKCGTTWLTALIFSIVNRASYKPGSKEHPLLTSGVKECIPYLELHLLQAPPIGDPDILPSPRLLCTHVPYTLLPETVTATEGCCIVCIWRNPKDALVSFWQFSCLRRQKIGIPPLSLEEASDLFLQGVSPYGPMWDNVLGYWKASLENPSKILFLKYEDMKSDTMLNVKRLAEFLGHPFTNKEEEGGIVHEIIKLCSFDTMSKAQVSDEGNFHEGRQSYKDFFRKGNVGDSKNHLTEEVIRRLDEITKEKFKGTTLEE